MTEFTVGNTYTLSVNLNIVREKWRWMGDTVTQSEYIGKLVELPYVLAPPCGYGDSELLKKIYNTDDLVSIPRGASCFIVIDVEGKKITHLLAETKDGKNGYIVNIEKM